MNLKRDNFCFACGKDNHRGLKMDIEFDEDGARCSYAVPEDMQGWKGITHGGLISTMLDEIMVWAAAGRNIDTVTGELTVRFKNPLPTNRTVTVQGAITKQHPRLVFAEARIFDGDTVYAEGTAKLFVIPEPVTVDASG